MPLKKKKILVMCCKGLFQDHMIQRLDEEFEVCGIVHHESIVERPFISRILLKITNPIETVKHIYSRLCLIHHEKRAEQFIKNTFFKGGSLPKTRQSIPSIDTNNVNCSSVLDFIKQHKPDIICVNGTNLIRDNLINYASNIPYGIINLHTGLSPYSRGGNCNLFMLLEKQPQLVGITVHHIDKGIDSGDIIITTQPVYENTDNYEIIDAKCFKLGIEAIIDGCYSLFNNTAQRTPQWQKGKLFLQKTGYQYKPQYRLKVNQLIRNGLIQDYLKIKPELDKTLRLVGDFKQPHV